MSAVEIITLTESNLGSVQMFCGHSPTYRQGYNAKLEWMQERLGEGMRYTLLQVDGCNAGMIEYVPAESAWRSVDANGYLFIHCFWVIGRNRGHGYGRKLLQACLEQAGGTNGVAVMVSKAHWLPTPRLFLKNGFELADQALPSFDLLVRRFNQQAPLPRFKPKGQTTAQGLTVYSSDQCPYTQNVPDIAEHVADQMNIPVNIVHLDSPQAAQAAPCAYGTLAYFFNGELLTYHPTGTEKLMGLIKIKMEQVA
jgi:GNAT superfamily N-acetyltransferase